VLPEPTGNGITPARLVQIWHSGGTQRCDRACVFALGDQFIEQQPTSCTMGSITRARAAADQLDTGRPLLFMMDAACTHLPQHHGTVQYGMIGIGEICLF